MQRLGSWGKRSKNKRETTSRDSLVQFFFFFVFFKNTSPFLMVINACPFNFLMQSYHMTMLTIFKLWGVGSTPFPTLTSSNYWDCVFRHGCVKGRKIQGKIYLDAKTHFKQTETFLHTRFTSCHPPNDKKGFVKGEALRILPKNSSETTFEENNSNLKISLKKLDGRRVPTIVGTENLQ